MQVNCQVFDGHLH